MTTLIFFPFWRDLDGPQRDTLRNAITLRHVSKGAVLHNGSEDCVGLFLVLKGQLRAYIVSDEGREITLYRLLERDMCLFSAACMMNSIQFDITISAERESEVLHIPTKAYQALMLQSAPVANYTNELMASRFTDVMWLLDQILYKRLDARLAAFLLEESGLDDTKELRLTHEVIAHHLGSAREVVTRMLKYFQAEGVVALSRGGVAILDERKLAHLAKGACADQFDPNPKNCDIITETTSILAYPMNVNGRSNIVRGERSFQNVCFYCYTG